MIQTRHGMHYKKGDILLIQFPFTDLQKSKKRPVVVISDSSVHGDFVCFQITSKAHQSCLVAIDASHLSQGELKLTSFVKYDKCFTLNNEIVDKKLATLNNTTIHKLKTLFCEEIF